METAKHSNHCVHLNSTFHSDLIWWHTYLVDWNGVSMLRSRACNVPTFSVTSDALGSCGCGALHNTQWFQIELSDHFKEEPIHFKELMPIIIASMVWGHQWSGHIVGEVFEVRIFSRQRDDAPLVHVIFCGSQIQFLVHCHSPSR